MHPRYRNENILNFTEAAALLGVTKSAFYRLKKEYPFRHPHRRGWYLKHRLELFLAGELKPQHQK
jgi:hypothetical protein